MPLLVAWKVRPAVPKTCLDMVLNALSDREGPLPAANSDSTQPRGPSNLLQDTAKLPDPTPFAVFACPERVVVSRRVGCASTDCWMLIPLTSGSRNSLKKHFTRFNIL
jgi:hypothetical protein